MVKIPFGGRGGRREGEPRAGLQPRPAETVDPFASKVSYYGARNDLSIEQVKEELIKGKLPEEVIDGLLPRITAEKKRREGLGKT